MDREFKVKIRRKYVPTETLLEDLKAAAKVISRSTITTYQYNKIGRYHSTTLIRRLGSWFTALRQAGLNASRSALVVTSDELFANLRDTWLFLGHQPTYTEINDRNISYYCGGTYANHFGSWTHALEEFANFIKLNPDVKAPEHKTVTSFPRDHKRHPSERLKAKVLIRDNCLCKICGKGPANDPSIALVVDHIIPWSLGGRTVLENLQALCLACNLKKNQQLPSSE